MDLSRVQEGLTGIVDSKVTKRLSINRTGRDGADILSTPGLLELMELACIKTTDNKLPGGYTTVGYAVDSLKHLAPTSTGSSISITVELTNVDRNKLTYKIEAFEESKLIGSAIHKRAVINIG
tara:strand:- start:259 stop:627 length:369 start_codon:yes stop_codon:yes gene_type:complete